ncbi:ribose 5-phosphate isomerase B [Fusibacter ferrireducens]|uniref:Ribose 5-phosphate isomerase B n=1 Tax=Fusibacter ferrireducens TaxID=2785058 RepID=A0ABR9ZVR9_9FIRM|nr:ribose 5-phosphate isomerase B [Fusibacter ferrireducens]MBF4694554.1 ribose 5-phosphate isomerase B [Fusibacter ferrireducens]
MKVAVGSDHGGLILKDTIVKHLQSKGYEVKDFGTYTAESCDYPDYALKVSEAIVEGDFELGVLICGTGLGISIAANKVKGIIAAPVSDTFSAEMARKHNNANIIALGARVVGEGLAIKIIDEFFNAEFEGGRHALRVGKIMKIESEKL